MKFYQNHISYCTNIHSYGSVDELIKVLTGPVKIVANAFKTEDFAVGLHLNEQVINQLYENSSILAKLQKCLADNNFYVCSLNCFPQGIFHNEVVKERVYQPNWGNSRRADYTIRAASILSQLLPAGVTGTISTVPICYGKKLPENTIENIEKVTNFLQQLPNCIQLTFEPEPDCYLDCTDDCIDFFKLLKEKLSTKQMQQLGICFDTCHFSVIFSNPAEELTKLMQADINIPKIQISSALKTNHPQTLIQFNEPIYLHQTAIKTEDGNVTRFPDLGQALTNFDEEEGEWRVHFHVPVHSQKLSSELATTSDELSEVMKIVNKMSNLHLEVETYSFNVIPDNKELVTDSIIKEIKFIIQEQ